MPAGDDADVNLANQLAQVGSGALGGAAIAGLVGTPPGGPLLAAGLAAAESVVGPTFYRVGSAIMRRHLEPRRELRAGAAFATAASEISARIVAGERLRDDGFFQRQDGFQSPSEEILEGTLAAAADSYEERKVPHLGHLFAALPFEPAVGPAYAHFLLRRAEGLTWQQLVCMSLFPDRVESTTVFDDLQDGLGNVTARVTGGIFAEIDELARDDLLGLKSHNPPGSGREEGMPERAPDPGGLASINPRWIVRFPVANDLARLMRLERIPQADVDEVAAEVIDSRVGFWVDRPNGVSRSRC